MILSVSRRTDVPNYYSDWFVNRIKEGFLYVRNPMNAHQISRIDLSPDVVDCIVFWTKNPANMMEKLECLKDYVYYFQFTLTGYGKDIELLKLDYLFKNQRTGTKIANDAWRGDRTGYRNYISDLIKKTLGTTDAFGRKIPISDKEYTDLMKKIQGCNSITDIEKVDYNLAKKLNTMFSLEYSKFFIIFLCLSSDDSEYSSPFFNIKHIAIGSVSSPIKTHLHQSLALFDFFLILFQFYLILSVNYCPLLYPLIVNLSHALIFLSFYPFSFFYLNTLFH